MIDPERVGLVLTEQVGFPVGATHTSNTEGSQTTVRPLGLHPNEAFTIECVVGWRRLNVEFVPGAFARDLVEQMSRSSEDKKRRFGLLAASIVEMGAEVEAAIGGSPVPPDSPEDWPTTWTTFELELNVGPLVIPEDHVEQEHLVVAWTGRLLTLMSLLLPLVDVEESDMAGEGKDHVTGSGFEEGGATYTLNKRYERDPRNRAICLAVHGARCQGCGLAMEERYGKPAAGFIHVHHLKPLAEMDEAAVMDPVQDLVPLCPNCHSVVHRRSPPYSVVELRDMIHDAGAN